QADETERISPSLSLGGLHPGRKRPLAALVFSCTIDFSSMQEADQSIDTLLHPFLKSTDESASQDLLTALVRNHADPVIRKIIRSKLQASFYGAGNAANHQETEDVYSEVIAQLLAELRDLKASPSEKQINHLTGFVAKLTLNACYRYLRVKYPQRHSLKNKVRYLLTHQPGFAIWEQSDSGLLCGYDAWQKQTRTDYDSTNLREIAADPSGFASEKFPKQSPQSINPRELVAAIFNCVGHALELDMLVSLLAEIWNVRDQYESVENSREEDTTHIRELADQRTDVANEVSNRLFLQRLWEEICELPPRQRAALLLNLRDGNGNTVVPLLPAVGIASIRQIAEALELTPQAFAGLWYDLPLEDSRIAELLGLTRQQIINLRKSARERLARRMKAL
ncbi:MAG TPA: hypothetical protein VEF04_16120, partial [Blastocatellia bacterium]|nr:hypothetical protein [Blastocatellia bacterium]